MKLLLNHTARQIDSERRLVTATNSNGQSQSLPYDRLIIGTGVVPAESTIQGTDLPGIHVLHSTVDGLRLQRHLVDTPPRSAVIVGAGYIGLAVADVLARRGIGQVTLVVRSGAMLGRTMSRVMTAPVEGELAVHGVAIIKGAAVRAIEAVGDRLAIQTAEVVQAMADLVLVATGVQPRTELAAAAGVATGVRGAIRVSCEVTTNVPDIYAAGDCTET